MTRGVAQTNCKSESGRRDSQTLTSRSTTHPPSFPNTPFNIPVLPALKTQPIDPPVGVLLASHQREPLAACYACYDRYDLQVAGPLQMHDMA